MELYYHNNHNTGPMRSLMVTLMRSCRQNVPTVNFGEIYVNKTSPFVQQILHQIGFYGVYRCGRIQYDCHLITALVERWRSETHSFHFRIGEATITLQDVQVIWGLPIDGEPVSGTDLERTSVQWQEYCMQFIGFAPEEGALKGSRLQVKAIIDHISHVHITPDTPHLTVVQYARAVALQITCSNRTGTDWVLQHILYITRWQRRYDTVIQRQPISNRRDTDRGYWEWYNNITRHFVSSSADRRVESGYQPGDAPMLQIVVC
ncbi:UNVERIFIED_CONTAM: Serine/threonine-protein phosphatase 7 long form [Sesamum radiatum]|uniref:Serine/threonine-protein phosphatase 7 long form n=1 Tax=Sesamum radiatum TaxID=300843 RepID=A0AAW2SMG6_SESRA